jgi:hypothetical protein
MEQDDIEVVAAPVSVGGHSKYPKVAERLRRGAVDAVES